MSTVEHNAAIGPQAAAAPTLESLPARLQGHSSDLLAGRLSHDHYRALLCVELQRAFHCSRASLWRFGGRVPGDLSLTCTAVFDAQDGASEGGDTLQQGEYREYFETLLRHGVYACRDVLDDPHLRGLVEPYFVPRGIRSLLDTTFKVNGRVFGVVCIEQTGHPRLWTSAEQRVLRQVAVQISLVVGRLEARHLSHPKP
ncbi:GAF domain-containing protein [Caldimonas brevitalea]|uniref:Histidine kinase sensor protein n=1 Tax=Caldimonas brevitalea TaxID=413882 RepID=A0A0G3BSP9_9BURK|nr:GAF domain-containing protein [Caldimonas brevitalea]AKJ30401.1 histidine kinase sensor protein [Caldimonas brevitalea]